MLESTSQSSRRGASSCRFVAGTELEGGVASAGSTSGLSIKVTRRVSIDETSEDDMTEGNGKDMVSPERNEADQWGYPPTKNKPV